ncbi:hypothetical protein EJD97_014085, partial [Solanum chilense]
FKCPLTYSFLHSRRSSSNSYIGYLFNYLILIFALVLKNSTISLHPQSIDTFSQYNLEQLCC